MRIRASMLVIAATLILGIAALSPNTVPTGSTSAIPSPQQVEPSRRSTDDPDARLNWEKQRLADPATGVIPPNIHAAEQAFAARLPQRENGWLNGASKSIPGWLERGPYNVGGRTRTLALDMSDPTYQTLLAGGISGGLWRTVDDGSNWTLTTGSSQLHSVTSLIQDVRAGHQSTWYYGTGELRGNSAGASGAPYRGNGVFKSTDGGSNWNLLPSTTADPTVFTGGFQYTWRLAQDASNLAQEEIYAAIYGEIMRSVDGGTSWTSVLGTGNESYNDVAVTSTGVVYATLGFGTNPGLYRSTDGINYVDITPSFSITNLGRSVIAIDPNDEDVVWFIAYNEAAMFTAFHSLWRYEYLSGDGTGLGGSWIDRSGLLDNLPSQAGANSWDYEPYSGYCQLLHIQPGNPDQVFLGGIHLIRSTDAFVGSANLRWVGGWTYADHHADLHWMVFHPTNPLIAYSGSDGGVHKTLNTNMSSINWTPLNNGYNTSQFYTIAIDPNLAGSDVVVGGMQDNGSWFTSHTFSTLPWIETLGGDGSFCAVADASTSPGTYYFSYQRGVVYRYKLGPLGSLSEWTRVDPTGGGAYQFINPFVLDPSDTDIMYLSSNDGVWRNNDLSAIGAFSNSTTSLNWDHLTTEVGVVVGALAVGPTDRTLYYGTADGRVYKIPNAHSAPVPTTPTDIYTGKGLPSGYVNSISVHPQDDDKVLLAFSNYGIASLWYSEDGGASWTDVEGNLAALDGPSIRSVAIMPFGGKDLFFAGTSTGMYSAFYLAGSNTVWMQEAPDILGNVVVDMLASRSSDGTIVAGTHGRGAFSLSVPVGTAVPSSARGRLALHQNVPNPFNPITVISFTLPAAGFAEVDIYDAAGRQVRRLVSGPFTEGTHERSWNGKDDAGRPVASGVYHYRLRTGDETVSRPMTLVR